MGVPEHLCRYPTAASIKEPGPTLRSSLGSVQPDCEHEVADSKRVDEFVHAYGSGELTEDERFTLMEIIIGSCDDHPLPVPDQPHWTAVVDILRANAQLHAKTIWYWSCLDEKGIGIEIADPPPVLKHLNTMSASRRICGRW